MPLDPGRCIATAKRGLVRWKWLETVGSAKRRRFRKQNLRHRGVVVRHAPIRLEAPGAEAVGEEGEDDERNDDVGPIALVEERKYREDHTRHGRGNQKKKAELNHAAGMQRDRFVKYSGKMAQRVGFAMESPVVRRRRAVTHEK